MADLTSLEESWVRCSGFAQAAQTATDTVSRMEGADAFRDDLDAMHRQAQETE